MRTFENKPGVSYDDTKSTVIFAEDMNAIGDRLEGGRFDDLSGPATIVADTDLYDLFNCTVTNDPTTINIIENAPTSGKKIIFEFLGTASSDVLTWTSSFVDGGVAIPTSIADGERLTVGFMYSTLGGLNKWRCIAVTSVT